MTWQWRAAVAARDEARRTLKMANEAVNTYFTTVSEEHLLNEPGMQPLREKLLKLSLPYYQAFAAQRSDDPALRADLARAYLNWGRITGDIGSKDESRKLLKTAVSQFEPLLRADPTDRDLQIGLATQLSIPGRQSLLVNNNDEGFEEVNRAAAVWTSVVSATPDDPEARRMLGRCYDLAAIFRVHPDPALSRQLFEKALTILNDDVRDFPAHTEAWRQLAGSYGNLAYLLGLLRARRPGRGRSTHRESDRHPEKTSRRQARQNLVPEGPGKITDGPRPDPPRQRQPQGVRRGFRGSIPRHRIRRREKPRRERVST